MEEGCAGGEPCVPSKFSALKQALSSEMLWEKELLASQTLTDLARGKERAGSGRTSLRHNQEAMMTFPCHPKKKSNPFSLLGAACPKPVATQTSEPHTHKNSDAMDAAPTSAGPPQPQKAVDTMSDIATALEDLHCKRNSSNPATPGQDEPKAKKRRRRRHEITRTWRCSLGSCTKSYGSEGALKTHVRLKHSNEKMVVDERRRSASVSSGSLDQRREAFSQFPASNFWFAGGAGAPQPQVMPMPVSKAYTTPMSPPLPYSPMSSSDFENDKPQLPPILSVLAGDGQSPEEANKLMEKQKEIPRLFNFVLNSGIQLDKKPQTR